MILYESLYKVFPFQHTWIFFTCLNNYIFSDKRMKNLLGEKEGTRNPTKTQNWVYTKSKQWTTCQSLCKSDIEISLKTPNAKYIASIVIGFLYLFKYITLVIYGLCLMYMFGCVLQYIKFQA